MLENLQNILKNKDSVVVISASILVCLIGVFIGNNLHDNDDEKTDVVSEIIKEDETPSSEILSSEILSSEPSSEPSSSEIEKIDDLKDETNIDDITGKDNIQLNIDEPENSTSEIDSDINNDNTGKGINDNNNELEDSSTMPESINSDFEKPLLYPPESTSLSFDKPMTSLSFDKPMETSSFDNPIESSSFDNPIESSSFDKPIESSSFDKPEERDPSRDKPVILEEYGGKNRSKKNRKNKKSKKSRKHRK